MNSRPSPVRHPTSANLGDRIIAIASGKGGVGKTWFAVTLSHTLAEAGGRILLFDGDLGLANIDIQLGLTGKRDLGDVMAGRISLRGAVSRFDDGGFHIIAGRSGSGSLANMPARRIADLRHQLFQLASKYDRTLIDMGAGVDQPIQTLLAGVGTCLVLTTPDPTALTDAYAFIKVTHMERPETNIQVIINMANSTREGERTYNTIHKACEGFLKFSPPLVGVIRRDSKVRETIRGQSSLLTRFPNSEAAGDVESISRKLLDEVIT